MDYRRKSGKKPLRRPVLIILLAGLALYVLLTGGFADFFSSPTEVKEAASPNELTSAKRLRHEIYDRNMDVLALSLRMYSVYAHPQELKKGEHAISQLTKILNIDGPELRRQFRGKKNFIWLKRHIDSKYAARIKELGLSGIYLVGEPQRLYPHGSVASQVIGFVKEEQGLAGTEFVYDNLLRGGWPPEPVNLGETSVDYRQMTKHGAAVVLTLDIKLQKRVEHKLAALIKRTGALSGMAVLLDAASGEIMASASLPAYDPNLYWNYSAFNRRNRVDDDPVYLGGLAAYLRLAAAVQTGGIAVSAAGPGLAARVISPRQIKRRLDGVLSISKGSWQKVRDGIYRLPYINESTALPDDAGLEEFMRQSGLGQTAAAACAYDLDCAVSATKLPAESGAQSPPAPVTLQPLAQAPLLDVAAAFARTINGGKKLIPHVLHGIWVGPENGEVKADFSSSAPGILFPNGDFLTYLQGKFSVKSSKTLVLESLLAVPEKVSKDIEFTGADAGGKVAETADNAVRRFEALGVGIYTAGTTPLVLAMALDGASRGYADKPVFSRTMAQIFRVTSSRRLKGGKGGVVKGAMRQGFSRQWRQIHPGKKALPLTMDSTARVVMPKLRGFSLRKSLQVLSGRGLHIRIVGAGRVTGQSPKAGISLKHGQDCQLNLRYPRLDEIDNEAGERMGSEYGTTTH